MSGKNHNMIDGKLLQMDKQYNALKMRQKEKIGTWLNEEITLYYRDHGNWPTREHEFQIVLDNVYEKIEAAEIWIPYSEIHKRFMGKRNSRINKMQSALAKAEKHSDSEAANTESKSLTINLYYTGTNGSAKAFAEEMVSSGLVDRIRAEEGNLRYEYFFPMDDPETVLLIDKWANEHALAVHHKSPMMNEIKKLVDNNLKVISAIEKNYTIGKVWAAWGNIIDTQFYLGDNLYDIQESITDAEWYYRGKLTKDGNPRHPLYLKLEEEFNWFAVGDYAAEWRYSDLNPRF